MVARRTRSPEALRPAPPRMSHGSLHERTHVEVFVPLIVNPQKAHDQEFDSMNRIKAKITKHLENLEDANWIGASMLRESIKQLNVDPPTDKWVIPVYALGRRKNGTEKGKVTLPPGMRVPAGYPDHRTSSFRGIIEFNFKNLETWVEFKYFMQQSDSEGPTTDSWFSELDLDGAHVVRVVSD